MPLFKKKNKTKNKDIFDTPKENRNGSTVTANAPATAPIAPRTQVATSFKHSPQLSKTQFDIGGLPINVFGLAELTPSTSRASAAPLPEVCVAIHMHGRVGSADSEEELVRHLWTRVQQSIQEQGRPVRREFILVNFDARNHGHRKTNDLGQQGWKQGNKMHAMDLYAMIVGVAQDVSFLVDFLPAYLFPNDDRKITKWVATGKSLGGHAVWHVLANDPRFDIGVPFISCPSYASLMMDRCKTSFKNYGPPDFPASLQSLVARVDPASRPYDSFDPRQNPYWGKKICMCSGKSDRLVPWRCGESFVRGLVTGEAEGPKGEMTGFRVVLLEDVGHNVTDTMIKEGGHWIYLHGIAAQ